jgi:hypothetical protein
MTLSQSAGPKIWQSPVKSFRRFGLLRPWDNEFDLESAVFLFHMSGMQPESSGQRELRVP